MSRFKHILVPTDFETPSSHALELAMELAQTFGAELTLLHVWEIPAYPYVGAAITAGELAASLEQAAVKQLDETRRRIQERLPRAKSVLRLGIPWREVVASTTTLGADLVVMGTHGRHGLSHAFVGSVAERVVRASPVPVLTVHGPGVQQK